MFPTWLSRIKERRAFDRDGYLILKGFVPAVLCDRIACEAEAAHVRLGLSAIDINRSMNVHHESPAAAQVLNDPHLLAILANLLRCEPVFLQSIYFARGSEQEAHSDYVFMSTEPDYQLCGVWLACEPVTADSGPLVYYPGSHRLAVPSLAQAYESRISQIREAISANPEEVQTRFPNRGNGGPQTLEGCYFYDTWLRDLSAQRDGCFDRQEFLPDKGDLIIWHANLVHGGGKIANPSRTRKSLIGHFLTTAVRRYYDMTYVDNQRSMTLEELEKTVSVRTTSVLQK